MGDLTTEGLSNLLPSQPVDSFDGSNSCALYWTKTGFNLNLSEHSKENEFGNPLSFSSFRHLMQNHLP